MTVVDQYKEEVDRLQKEKSEKIHEKTLRQLSEVTRQCQHEVFLDLVKKNKRHLSCWLIQIPGDSGPAHGLAHLIGKINGKDLFCTSSSKHDLNFFHKVSIKDVLPPQVEYIGGVEALGWQDRMDVLTLLEERSSKREDVEVIMPSGFFIFRYNSQFVCSAYDGDPTERIDVVKADDLEGAIQKFKINFCFRRDNCFSNFCVCFDGYWKPLTRPFQLIFSFSLDETKFELQ